MSMLLRVPITMLSVVLVAMLAKVSGTISVLVGAPMDGDPVAPNFVGLSFEVLHYNGCRC